VNGKSYIYFLFCKLVPGQSEDPANRAERKGPSGRGLAESRRSEQPNPHERENSQPTLEGDSNVIVFVV
jgi:hypothetical protein